MKINIYIVFLMFLTPILSAQNYNLLTDYSYHSDVVKNNNSCNISNNGIPLPSAKQLAFQDLELGMFIHFGLSTYSGQASGDGKQSPKMFNPVNLNCEQWMQTAKDMGAKYVVLTTRHEGGMCLWPSNTTDYCVKQSPWKKGKGDVVKEYVDAARKYGLKVGFYHSSWHDANQMDWRNSKYFEGKPEELERFTRQELEQLHELLTNYGKIDMIWFDHHGCPGVGASQFWLRVNRLVSALQPNCMIFGLDYWINGGHSGGANYPLWYGVNTGDGTPDSRVAVGDADHGNPYGRYFRVWEANTPFSGNWFYCGPKVAKVETMVEKYYKTIGYGANFLPNFAPDKSGVMPPEVVKKAKAFGDELRKRFGNKIGSTKGGKDIQLSLGRSMEIKNIILMEDVSRGQKVASFEVDVKESGSWKTIYKGQTIGHKHIISVDVKTDELRFRCTKSLDDKVVIKDFSVY